MGEIVDKILVILEVEMTSILTDYFDILPAKAGEAFFGDLAQRWGKVDQEDGAEQGWDIDQTTQLFNIVTSSSANLTMAQYSLCESRSLRTSYVYPYRL